jgi:two-component system, OmpR family, response regulator
MGEAQGGLLGAVLQLLTALRSLAKGQRSEWLRIVAQMSSRLPQGPSDADVFVLTAKGNRQLKASSGTSLSTAELAILVLVDGISPFAQIVARAASMSREFINENIGKLRADGLIVTVAELDSGTDESGFSTISVPAGFFSSITASVDAEASSGVSILKKKGYYVRIARRPAEPRESKEGWVPTILVVDDDPDLQKLMGMFLKLEGFQVRQALKRDDILAALRQAPMPDLILLDVQLPDANGFEILAKFRLHPALKNLPVVMLTGESTREAVLKGLQGGADGYVTKPYEPEAVINAVKAVLGLTPPPAEKKK